MRSIAIIPARGQSKRIPRKNLRSFCGRPILDYSIEAALQSGLFDEVMVSTEDEEIAQLAVKNGASVPFMRSDTTSDDFATTSEVLLEVFHTYAGLGKTFHIGCCLYPTAPFVTAELLRDAFQCFLHSKASALVPVVAFSYPPLRGFVIENESLRMKWPENRTARSQDLETIYHDSGQFYLFQVDDFLRSEQLFMKKTTPYIIDEAAVQDIDTETDWALAEMKYRLLKEKE